MWNSTRLGPRLWRTCWKKIARPTFGVSLRSWSCRDWLVLVDLVIGKWVESRPGRMLGRLREMLHVLEVYEDPLFTGKLFSLPPSIHITPNQRSSWGLTYRCCEWCKPRSKKERILRYLKEAGSPNTPLRKLRKSIYPPLDLACQLCFARPLKTKPSSMGPLVRRKPWCFKSYRRKVLNSDFGSSRRNDFTGAHDYYFLWRIPWAEWVLGFGSTEEGTGYSNKILQVLDGQERGPIGLVVWESGVSETSKCANGDDREQTYSTKEEGPVRARFLRLPF